MTLRRQLFLGLSLIFLLVFCGLLALTVTTTADYLEQQLGSQAQETATALSQSLQPAIAKGDRVLMETQVASVFDRGYFQRILLLSTTAEPLVVKELPLKIEDVPLWFSELVRLKPPVGEAFVSSGWRQFGKVLVMSQPTFAYRHLWSFTLKMSFCLVLAYLLALALTQVILGYILRPLAQIEHSAIAIREKRFEQIDPLPKTQELYRVVAAMNQMSSRISEMLDAETAKAEGFRREAYEDSMTGLENRPSFNLRLNQLLDGESRFTGGALVAIEVDGLKEYNIERGYRQGNAILTALAHAVRSVIEQRAAILSRIGGNSFAFVLLDVAGDDLEVLCRSIRDRLVTELAQCGAGGAVSISIGGAWFQEGNRAGQLLGRADLAVEAARHSGRNAFRILLSDHTDSGAVGSQGWRTLIQNALAENRWVLVAQPVITLADQRPIHREVMARLIDNHGQLVLASCFLPMALRHALVTDVDRALLTLALEMLSRPDYLGQDVAINVSAQSVAKEEFLSWLNKKLVEVGPLAAHLSFEISEFGCLRKLDATKRFQHMLHERGARFGIDHFGLDPRALELLRQIPPDYLKLDGGLITDLNKDENAHAMVRSIIHVARSLDVQVIAQFVENAEQVAMLMADEVDGGQGYYFGMPEQV